MKLLALLLPLARAVRRAPGDAVAWFRADPWRVAAAVVLLVGLVIRVLFLPDARFTGDESLFYERAMRVVGGEWFPTVGPAVTGGPFKHPGGTFYLLMSLPLFFSSSPYGPMLVVVTLNLIGYALLFTAVRRLLGAPTALVFLVLLVTSPWSLFYSDRIWNSNLVLPLTALVLWALVDVVQRPRSRRVGWVVFGILVFPQFHLSVGLLLFVVLVVWAVHRPAIDRRGVWVGALAAFLLYLPYLVLEVWDGFPNTREAFSVIGEGTEGLTEAIRGTICFLTFPTTEISYFAERGYWFPHDTLHYYGAEGPGLAGMATFLGGGAWGDVLAGAVVATVVLVAAAFVGLLVALVVSSRARRVLLREQPLVPAFFAAVVAVPALLALAGKPFVPHYALPLFPLAFVPLLLGVRALTARRAGLVAVSVLTLALATANVATAARYYGEVDARVSIPSTEEVVRTIYEVGRDRSCKIRFDMEKYRLDSRPILRLAKWRFGREIHEAEDADVRIRIFTPLRWAAFRALPEFRQRIDGVRVAGSRELTHVVLAWADRAAPRPAAKPVIPPSGPGRR